MREPSNTHLRQLADTARALMADDKGLLAMDAQTGEWTVAPTELRGAREVPLSQTVQDVISERVDRLLLSLAA